MTGTPENARLWTGADVYVAPVGSTAPTTLVAALDAAFDPLGLLGTDGLTESRESDSSDFFAWGGTLVRTVRSKHKRTFSFVALEDNPTTFGLANPGSEIAAAVSGVVTRTIKTPTKDERAFLFQMSDGDEISRRRIIPRGEVTEIGDVTYTEEDLAVIEFTVTVYPASDGVLFLDIGNEDAFVSP